MPTTYNNDRPNAELASAVEQALAKVEPEGIQAAVDFLNDHGAGFALTCRVLTEPDRRRARPVDLPRLAG